MKKKTLDNYKYIQCTTPVLHIAVVLIAYYQILFQSSDAASLHALELLMNEFFDASTNNHRKREIGVLYMSGIIYLFIIL